MRPATAAATRFVVLFQGRTGSTYLTEGLDGHPEIRALGEQLVTIELVGNGPTQLEWVDRYYASPPAGVRAVGFKTKLKDVVDPDGLSRILRRWQVRVVLLQRRNLVKWVVSFFNSMRVRDETGDWNLYRAEDRPPPFGIDPDEFDSWLGAVRRQCSTLEDFAGGLELPLLRLDYEELLVDEPRFWRRVLSFLGVSERPLQGACVKVTSDDLRRIVTNLEELRSRYRGTPYEAMFDEVMVP